MKKSFFCLLIVVGTAGLMSSFSFCWAQPPAIGIDLVLDKTSYQFGESVGVEVVVSNDSGKDLLISKGFSSRVYYLEMRVIDPAGRLLIARNIPEPTEMSDPPLLPYVQYQGQVIRVGRCEGLSAGWSQISQTNDLRTYFPMELPGYYSAQVQLSAMVFKGPLCNVNDYEWLGVIKSETKYFYTEGETEVHVVPNEWHLSWEQGQKNQDIQVQINPGEGKTVNDYRSEGIALNNKAAKRVQVLPSMIRVYFDPKESIESLGPVEVGKWYPVVISGRLKSDEPFGGGQEVRIHK